MHKQVYILISGKKRSGKDTLANTLASQNWANCEVFSFASKIKQALDPVAKEFNFDIYKSESDKEVFRPLLQTLGKVMRNVDIDYWAKYAYKSIKEVDKTYCINTDTRFINEINYFKNLAKDKQIAKVITIRIVNDTDVINDFDISETALDEYQDFDIILNKSDYFEYDFNLKKYVPNFFKLNAFARDFWKNVK